MSLQTMTLCWTFFLLLLSICPSFSQVFSNENEAETPKIQCFNNGKPVLIHPTNGTYKCMCPIAYYGKFCEIPSHECLDLNDGRGVLTCPREMKCERTSRGGFNCKNLTLPKGKAKYCDEKSCPNHWTCFKKNKIFEGYTCQPLVATVGESDLYWDFKNLVTTPRHKRNVDEFCNAILCQNSFDCFNGTCKCIEHYEGKYCEREVDYCAKNNPCGPETVCIPKFASYECQIKEQPKGTHRLLSNYGLIYQPVMFENVTSYLLFYTMEKGHLINISFNFDDGRFEKAFSGQEIYYRFDVFKLVERFIYPPFNLPAYSLYVRDIRHKYTTPGFRKITVKGTHNGDNFLFMRRYPVRVESIANCNIKTKLYQMPQNLNETIRISRLNNIIIKAGATLNCIQHYINYTWSIKKLNLNRKTKEKVFVNDSQIPLIPYAEYGLYTLNVTSYLLHQNKENQKSHSQISWFEIVRKKLLAHIDGGSTLKIQSGDFLMLDGSKSIDPNYYPKDQPPLNYSWNCYHPEDDYCKGDPKSPIETSKTLSFSKPNTKIGNIYTITLTVTPADGNIEYADSKTIRVQIVRKTHQVRINCLMNCLGNKAYSQAIIILQGWCHNCDNPDWKNSLVLINKTEVKLNHYKFKVFRSMSQANYFLPKNILKPGENYTITFMIRNNNVNESCEYHITTPSLPVVETCTIDPTEGFAIFTNFSLKCSVNEDLRKNFITYIVYQETEEKERLMVTYDFSGSFTGMILSPGKKEKDYETTLQVVVRDEYTMESYPYDITVTVYPAYAYIPNPLSRLYKFKWIMQSNPSPVALFSMAHNFPMALQIILVSATSLRQFANDEDVVKQISAKLLKQEVAEIEHTMLMYFNKNELMSHLYIAHKTDVVHSILQLSFEENSNLNKMLTTQILVDIITDLTELEKMSFFVNHLDFNYIMHSIMRITKLVLRGTSSAKYCNLIETMELDEVRAKIMWEQKLIDDEEKKKARALNKLTDEEVMEKFPYSIFSVLNLLSTIYLRHVMLYKVEQFATPDVAVTLHKIVPRLIATPQLEVGDLAVFTLFYSDDMMDNRDYLAMNILAIKENPIWKCPHVTRLPYVQFNITNAKLMMYKEFESEIKFKIDPNKWGARKIEIAKVPIKTHWILQDSDIQIYRVYVSPKNYQFIHFKALPRGLKIMIVLKTTPPTLMDFWNSSTTLPENRYLVESGHSIFVKDDHLYENRQYYLGILCHEETVRYFLSFKSPNTLFSKIIHSYDPIKMEKESKYVRNLQQNGTFLDIPFSIHQSRCFSLDITHNFWFPNCKVMPETSHEGVVCRCFNATQVTVNFRDVVYKNLAIRKSIKQFKTTRGGIDYYNVCIILLMGGILLLYLILFNYCQGKDAEDSMKSHLIYLADNDPSFKCKYLIGIYTGAGFNTGTTSNVTIVLEGTACRSLPHVLQSLDQPVMTRGSHDWFLMRTKQNLGNLVRIHLWTDYSGLNPEWYCQKVFIQDTKTRNVWIFNVERWFSPLVNDGTMACTTYRAKDENIFNFSYRFKHIMNMEIKMGTHLGLGIVNHDPFSGFNRAQRATVFIAYICMILYGTILITDYVPPAESLMDQISQDLEYNLKIIDVIKGIFIAMLICPLRFALALCCRFLLYDDNPKSYVKWTKVEESKDKDNKDTILIKDDEETKSLQPYICQLETSNLTNVKDLSGPKDHKLEVVPFVAENIYRERIYIAPGLIFLWWFLMIFIILSCVYKTIIHGFGLEDVQVKQFFVISRITLMFSIFILETFILFVWVLIKTFFSASFIWIEDRTIEVKRLVKMNKLPNKFLAPAQLALAKLRREHVYRPLDQRKCRHYKKIAVMMVEYRRGVVTLMILALIVGIMVILLNEMYDPNRNLVIYKTEQLLDTRKGYRTISYKHVRNTETFYQYVNETLLTNLNNNIYGEKTGITADNEHYFVGVPRIRQVRVAPAECQHGCNFSELVGFDTENYDTNWTLRISEDGKENDSHLSHMWHYKEKSGLMIPGRFSEYPISGYLLLLRRSLSHSRKILDYMVQHNWLENRTRAAFIDLVLYNPKMNFLVLVQIVAEKINFVEFSTSLNLQVINFYPDNSGREFYKLKIIVVLIGLTLFLLYKDLLHCRSKMLWFYNIFLNISIFYLLSSFVSYSLALSKFQSFIEKLNLNIFYNFYPLVNFNHEIIMNSVFVIVFAMIRLIHLIYKIFFSNEPIRLLGTKLSKYQKRTFYFLVVWCTFLISYTIYNVVHVSVKRLSDQAILILGTVLHKMTATPSKYYRNQYITYMCIALLSLFTIVVVIILRVVLEYFIYCGYLESKKQKKEDVSEEKLNAIGHLVSDLFMQHIGVEETKIDNKKINRQSEREKAMASLLLATLKPAESDPDEEEVNDNDDAPVTEEVMYRYKRSLDVINNFSVKMQKLESVLQKTLPLFTSELKDGRNNEENIDQ